MLTAHLQKHGFDFFDAGFFSSISEVGAKYGNLFTVPGMQPIQLLTVSSGKTANTYSGIFGVKDFPLHTDLAHWHRPPRYFALRCVVPDESISTQLLSAASVLPCHSDSDCKRALFRPRRRVNGHVSLLRLAEPHLFRWDSVFLEPTNASATHLKALIEESMHRAEVEIVRFTVPGQVLIIDNWNMLHGRVGLCSESPRELERVYLQGVTDGD